MSTAYEHLHNAHTRTHKQVQVFPAPPHTEIYFSSVRSVCPSPQDGVIDVDEFIALMTSTTSAHKPSLAVLLAAAEEASDVDFSELSTAPGGCFRIPDTAKRAISLQQLERVVKHVAKRLGYSWKAPVVQEYRKFEYMPVRHFTTELGRWERGWLGGESWSGKRPDADGKFHDAKLALQDVNLYDCCKYVITPATAVHRCSFVELMASAEQPPHYFVSHVRAVGPNSHPFASILSPTDEHELESLPFWQWWGEAIVDFLKCIQRHSHVRGLETAEGKDHKTGRECFGLSKHVNDPHPAYLGGESPRYWVCAVSSGTFYTRSLHLSCSPPCTPEFPSTALQDKRSLLLRHALHCAQYANNQHNLDGEISDDLSQTSFYRAMRLSMGMRARKCPLRDQASTHVLLCALRRTFRRCQRRRHTHTQAPS